MFNYVNHGPGSVAAYSKVPNDTNSYVSLPNGSFNLVEQDTLVNPMLRNQALDCLSLGTQYKVRHRSTWHWVLTRPNSIGDSGPGPPLQVATRQRQEPEKMMVRKFYVLIKPISLNAVATTIL